MRRALSSLGALCLIAIFALSANAQDNSAPPPASAPSSSQPAEKKVWTNDDVGDLRADAPISTVGGSAGKSSKPARASTGAQGPKNAQWYHDQIAKLEDQLPPLDAKIAQLQAGISGKFTGDGKESTRPSYGKFGDWTAELQDLQKKRDDIAAHASALRDQARRAGIPANALP